MNSFWRNILYNTFLARLVYIILFSPLGIHWVAFLALIQLDFEKKVIIMEKQNRM